MSGSTIHPGVTKANRDGESDDAMRAHPVVGMTRSFPGCLWEPYEGASDASKPAVCFEHPHGPNHRLARCINSGTEPIRSQWEEGRVAIPSHD